MTKKNTKPTDSELLILQVLWSAGAQTVRQVNEAINQSMPKGSKEMGYTTTLKLMQIMSEKGLAVRDVSQRTHVYDAAISEADTQQSLLDTFLKTTFKGSAKSLVMQALGNHKASKEELNEIKKLINQLENE